MDRILMEGMAFFGRHGVFPAERQVGTHIEVDVEMEADLTEAGHSDRLEYTVNYARAYEAVREVVEQDSCHLLEAVAQRIADRLLDFERVQRVRVRVRKRPPLPGTFRSFGVEVSRGR